MVSVRSSGGHLGLNELPGQRRRGRREERVQASSQDTGVLLSCCHVTVLALSSARLAGVCYRGCVLQPLERQAGPAASRVFGVSVVHCSCAALPLGATC